MTTFRVVDPEGSVSYIEAGSILAVSLWLIENGDYLACEYKVKKATQDQIDFVRRNHMAVYGGE